jgi:hypothetical protein
MSGGVVRFDVVTRGSSWRNGEPLLTELGPSFSKSFVVSSLSPGKVSDDDVEVARYAAEESRKLF